MFEVLMAPGVLRASGATPSANDVTPRMMTVTDPLGTRVLRGEEAKGPATVDSLAALKTRE